MRARGGESERGAADPSAPPGAPAVQLAPRPGDLARCVYCHDDLGARALACGGCGVLLHEACELDACPTLGCADGSTWRVVERRGPGRVRRRAAPAAALAFGLAAGTVAVASVGARGGVTPPSAPAAPSAPGSGAEELAIERPEPSPEEDAWRRVGEGARFELKSTERDVVLCGSYALMEDRTCREASGVHDRVRAWIDRLEVTSVSTGEVRLELRRSGRAPAWRDSPLQSCGVVGALAGFQVVSGWGAACPMPSHDGGATLVLATESATTEEEPEFVADDVEVVVPAGVFRCRYERAEAAPRHGVGSTVETWWAPGLPVPVRRVVSWRNFRVPEGLPASTETTVLLSWRPGPSGVPMRSAEREGGSTHEHEPRR